MKARLKFEKALLQLDRGREGDGVTSLREAIASAEAEDDGVTLVRSLVCLGELLSNTNQFEASNLLNRAIQIEIEPDLLAWEKARAIEILSLLK